MTPSRIRPAFVIWVLAMPVIVLSGWILLPFARRSAGWEVVDRIDRSVAPRAAGLRLRPARART